MVAAALTVDHRTRLRTGPDPLRQQPPYEPLGGARQLFFTTAPEVLLEGPAGCVAGETRLFDPTTGAHVPIRDLYERGEAPMVLTLAGPVRATVPFRKGVAPLYRVTLSSGRSFLGTDNHRVLTPAGWTFVAHVVAGDHLLAASLVLQESDASASRSALRQGARHSAQTAPGFLAHYAVCHRRGGEQPHQMSDSVQARIPSPDDARVHSRAGRSLDVPAASRAHTRPDPRSAPRATMDYSQERSDQTACMEFAGVRGMPSDGDDCRQRRDISQRVLRPQQPCEQPSRDSARTCCAPVLPSAQRCASSADASLDSRTLQRSQPSRKQSWFPRRPGELHAADLRSTACSPSFATSKYDYTAHWDTVSSITYERTDEYFDLHVPGAEHYLAEGIWHHNTGKSLACLHKLDRNAIKYPGSRQLIVRKTRTSLTQTALITFERQVIVPGGRVRFHTTRQAYLYPNGSEIVVGGLDKDSKVMSSEYDCIYCLVGETRIESDTPIEKAYVREYSGPLVTIKTAAGNELTGTPNHPILTDKGWVALGLLNEGDHVISRFRVKDERTGGNPDVEHQPPTIAEIARAFSLSPASRTERVVTVGMDFHGDGGNGYVDIVSAGGSLHDGLDAALVDPVIERDGVGRHFQPQALMGFRAAGSFTLGMSPEYVSLFGRDAEVAESFPVLVGIDPSLSRAGTCLAETSGPIGVGIADVPLALCLAHGAGLETTMPQRRLESAVADTEGCGDGVETSLAGEVAPDRIVHVARFDQLPGMSRHVYNLQTQDHRYIANNIISHNCQEATELTESDWEALTTRLRNGVVPHQQLIADCNPDAETHWLNKRCAAGKTTRLYSRHEDNPALWDRTRQTWTVRGATYIRKLDALSGVRYQRLRLGQWAAAEGQVYEGWDPAVHLIDRFDIPDFWDRLWTIDFGFVHPFVWQAWAIGPDGVLYRYREIYLTHRLVADHARDILHVTAGDPPPVAVITDHDAEDRATFEAETGYTTTPAIKNVSAGMQAVARRLAGEGAGPRIFFLRDSLVERDQALAEAGLPTCTEEEFPSYVWDTRQGRMKGEAPVKKADHGMDTTRYTVAHVDLASGSGELSGDFAAYLETQLGSMM